MRIALHPEPRDERDPLPWNLRKRVLLAEADGDNNS
jgi:hypothetical protein